MQGKRSWLSVNSKSGKQVELQCYLIAKVQKKCMLMTQSLPEHTYYNNCNGYSQRDELESALIALMKICQRKQEPFPPCQNIPFCRYP